jgi:hypothetical protein
LIAHWVKIDFLSIAKSLIFSIPKNRYGFVAFRHCEEYAVRRGNPFFVLKDFMDCRVDPSDLLAMTIEVYQIQDIKNRFP